MKFDTNKLALAISKAVLAGLEFEDVEDSGTCNMDSAYIVAKGMTEKQAKAIGEASGVNVFLGSHFGTRVLFLSGARGQANRRAKMMSAQLASLRASGVDAGGYYQMD